MNIINTNQTQPLQNVQELNHQNSEVQIHKSEEKSEQLEPKLLLPEEYKAKLKGDNDIEDLSKLSDNLISDGLDSEQILEQVNHTGSFQQLKQLLGVENVEQQGLDVKQPEQKSTLSELETGLIEIEDSVPDLFNLGHTEKIVKNPMIEEKIEILNEIEQKPLEKKSSGTFSDFNGSLNLPSNSGVLYEEDPAIKTKFVKNTQIFPDIGLKSGKDYRVDVKAGEKCSIRKTDRKDILFVEKYSLDKDKNLVIDAKGYIKASDVPKLHLRSHVALDKKAPIFPHKPVPEDIKQGKMGDCFFLAGLSSIVANHPEKITDMIKDNGDGTVTVRLFNVHGMDDNKTFTPHFIKFDKSILQTTLSIREHADTKAPWVALLEKAYALHKGSYAMLGEGGNASDVYEVMLGKPATKETISKATLDQHVKAAFKGDAVLPHFELDQHALTKLGDAKVPEQAIKLLTQKLADQVSVGLSYEEFDALFKGQDLNDEQKLKIQNLIKSPDKIALDNFFTENETKINDFKAKNGGLSVEFFKELFAASAIKYSSMDLLPLQVAFKGKGEKIKLMSETLNSRNTFSDLQQVKLALEGKKPDLSDEDIDLIMRTLPAKPLVPEELQIKVLDYINKSMQGKRGSGVYSQDQLKTFTQIENGIASGKIMGGGTLNKIVEEDGGKAGKGGAGEEVLDGMVGGHDFSISGVVTLKPGDKGYPGPKNGPELKFVKVRNPWGTLPKALEYLPSALLQKAGVPEHGSRKYVYDEKSQKLGAKGARDAEAMVELSDFCRHFEFLYTGSAN